MLKLWIAIFIFLMITNQAISDWPQWRGEQRDGIAHGIQLPKKWPANIQPSWMLNVGAGQSSPIVAKNHAYVFSREGEEEVVRSIDLATGKVSWRSSYQAPYEVYPGAASFGSGPKSTPAVMNGRLYTLGISGIVSCFDAEKGNLIWQRDFTGQFKKSYPPFGASMSPLITNGFLIVHVGGHEGGAMIAFDPQNGAEKWRWTGEGPSYSSPILVRVSGQDMIVTQVHRKIIGLDPAKGELLWSIPFVTPCDQNIVTPVAASDLLIFSSLDSGIFAVRLKRDGKNWTPERIWHSSDVSLYMSSPIAVNGSLFGFSHRKKGQFFALNPLNGEILWTSPGAQAENASLVAVGASVLALKDDGELMILGTTGKSFETSANLQVAKSGTWAHPVPLNQGLLIKDDSSLYFFKLS